MKQKKDLLNRSIEIYQQFNEQLYLDHQKSIDQSKETNQNIDLKQIQNYPAHKIIQNQQVKLKLPDLNRINDEYRFKNKNKQKSQDNMFQLNIDDLIQNIQIEDLDQSLPVRVSNKTDLDLAFDENQDKSQDELQDYKNEFMKSLEEGYNPINDLQQENSQIQFEQKNKQNQLINQEQNKDLQENKTQIIDIKNTNSTLLEGQQKVLEQTADSLRNTEKIELPDTLKQQLQIKNQLKANLNITKVKNEKDKVIKKKKKLDSSKQDQNLSILNENKVLNKTLLILKDQILKLEQKLKLASKQDQNLHLEQLIIKKSENQSSTINNRQDIPIKKLQDSELKSMNSSKSDYQELKNYEKEKPLKQQNQKNQENYKNSTQFVQNFIPLNLSNQQKYDDKQLIQRKIISISDQNKNLAKINPQNFQMKIKQEDQNYQKEFKQNNLKLQLNQNLNPDYIDQQYKKQKIQLVQSIAQVRQILKNQFKIQNFENQFPQMVKDSQLLNHLDLNNLQTQQKINYFKDLIQKIREEQMINTQDLENNQIDDSESLQNILNFKLIQKRKLVQMKENQTVLNQNVQQQINEIKQNLSIRSDIKDQNFENNIQIGQNDTFQSPIIHKVQAYVQKQLDQKKQQQKDLNYQQEQLLEDQKQQLNILEESKEKQRLYLQTQQQKQELEKQLLLQQELLKQQQEQTLKLQEQINQQENQRLSKNITEDKNKAYQKVSIQEKITNQQNNEYKSEYISQENYNKTLNSSNLINYLNASKTNLTESLPQLNSSQISQTILQETKKIDNNLLQNRQNKSFLETNIPQIKAVQINQEDIQQSINQKAELYAKDIQDIQNSKNYEITDQKNNAGNNQLYDQINQSQYQQIDDSDKSQQISSNKSQIQETSLKKEQQYTDKKDQEDFSDQSLKISEDSEKSVYNYSFFQKSLKMAYKNPQINLLTCEDQDQFKTNDIYYCSKQCTDYEVCDDFDQNQLFQLNIEQSYEIGNCKNVNKLLKFEVSQKDIFEYTFKIMQKSKASFWDILDDDQLSYHSFEEKQNDLIVVQNSYNCQDGNFTFSFQSNKTETDSCVGMIFRYQDAQNYNEINFCFNNTVTLSKVEDNVRTITKSLNSDINENEPNFVQLLFYQRQIILYLNDQLTLIKNDVQYMKGNIGFRVVNTPQVNYVIKLLISKFTVKQLFIKRNPFQYLNQMQEIDLKSHQVNYKNKQINQDDQVTKFDKKIKKKTVSKIQGQNKKTEKNNETEKQILESDLIMIIKFRSQKCVLMASSDNQECNNQTCRLVQCQNCCKDNGDYTSCHEMCVNTFKE